MHKSPLYYLIAQYRIRRGYHRGAVYYYRKLVELHPGSIKLQSRLAELLYIDKQYDKAIEYVDKILTKYPENTELSFIKIRSLMKLSRYDEAVEICNLVIEENPDNYSVLIMRADIHLTRHDDEMAHVDYQRAAETASTDSQKSYCYHSLGFIALRTQKNGAEDWFEKAVETSDKLIVKQTGVGALHFRRGWYDLARQAYELRIAEDSENSSLYFELGRVHTKLLDVDKAAEAYKNFVKYDKRLTVEKHKLNEKLVVFDAYMGRNFACSPRAIYEEMLRNPEYKEFKFVWVFGGSSFRKHWKLHLNPRTTVVKYKSGDYFRAYARAKYWVTNSRIPFVLKTHEEQVYIQCWHGTPLKRMGHSVVGTGQASKYSKNSLIELYDHEAKRLDYFISPSKRASQYFTEAFNLKQLNKEDVLIEQGYPRNDFLANHKTSDVMHIKKKFGIPASKKVLLYAPTWRDDQHDSDRGYTYKTQADFDQLQKSLGDDWIILFRAHYFIANSFNFDKYKGFIHDASSVDDVNDLYIISDVLMTDYSSVFFDYANLGRPIVFFMYDLEHYMNDLRGFYINLDKLPGDIVKTEDEIIGILTDLSTYSKKHQSKYKEFHDTFNYLDDGRAARRVLKKVIS